METCSGKFSTLGLDPLKKLESIKQFAVTDGRFTWFWPRITEIITHAAKIICPIIADVIAPYE